MKYYFFKRIFDFLNKNFYAHFNKYENLTNFDTLIE